MKTVELIKSRQNYGWTWRGNEDGYAMHTNCIIALYEGRPIGDPESWLRHHHLYTKRRQEAIRKIDLGKGQLNDISVIKGLAKRLNMIVSKGKQEWTIEWMRKTYRTERIATESHTEALEYARRNTRENEEVFALIPVTWKGEKQADK